jgi:hypothetical protein
VPAAAQAASHWLTVPPDPARNPCLLPHMIQHSCASVLRRPHIDVPLLPGLRSVLSQQPVGAPTCTSNGPLAVCCGTTWSAAQQQHWRHCRGMAGWLAYCGYRLVGGTGLEGQGGHLWVTGWHVPGGGVTRCHEREAAQYGTRSHHELVKPSVHYSTVQ